MRLLEKPAIRGLEKVLDFLAIPSDAGFALVGIGPANRFFEIGRGNLAKATGGGIMAQSIRAQIGNGSVEVEHKGQKALFDLPEWLARTHAVLDDKNRLVQELDDSGQLLGVLHQGLSQCVIGVRAVSRPNPTKSDPNPAFPTEGLRKKAREWNAPVLPAEDGGRLSKREKAIKALTDLGFTREQAEAAIESKPE